MVSQRAWTQRLMGSAQYAGMVAAAEVPTDRNKAKREARNHALRCSRVNKDGSPNKADMRKHMREAGFQLSGNVTDLSDVDAWMRITD